MTAATKETLLATVVEYQGQTPGWPKRATLAEVREYAKKRLGSRYRNIYPTRGRFEVYRHVADGMFNGYAGQGLVAIYHAAE